MEMVCKCMNGTKKGSAAVPKSQQCEKKRMVTVNCNNKDEDTLHSFARVTIIVM